MYFISISSDWQVHQYVSSHKILEIKNHHHQTIHLNDFFRSPMKVIQLHYTVGVAIQIEASPLEKLGELLIFQAKSLDAAVTTTVWLRLSQPDQRRNCDAENSAVKGWVVD